MGRRRGLFAGVAVLVLGVAMIVVGEVMYQASAAQAARINSQCRDAVPCAAAVANPAFLGIVGLGVLVAFAGAILTIYAIGTTRRRKATPA